MTVSVPSTMIVYVRMSWRLELIFIPKTLHCFLMRPDVNLMRQNEPDLEKVETEYFSCIYILTLRNRLIRHFFYVISVSIDGSPLHLIRIVWMLIAFQNSLTY